MKMHNQRCFFRVQAKPTGAVSWLEPEHLQNRMAVLTAQLTEVAKQLQQYQDSQPTQSHIAQVRVPRIRRRRQPQQH